MSDIRRRSGAPRGRDPHPGLYRIPVFGLYGSEAPAATPGYAHIETISSRASANDWLIASHRHAQLAQCILVRSGGGLFEAEGLAIAIEPPWTAWLPAGVVHGFRFMPGTEGFVLTVSDDVVAAALRAGAADSGLAVVAAEPWSAPLKGAADIGIDLDGIMAGIAREEALPRPASATVVVTSLALVLVALARLRTLDSLDRRLGAETASEFRRFRAYVEEHFRRQPTVSDMAQALGITADRLHAVTTRAVGRGPLAVQHERLMLECRRELIYTDRRISAIAFDCGFCDLAYFSRFFARRAGLSPTAFRKAHGGAALAGA